MHQQEDHERHEQSHAITVQVDAQAVDGLLVALGLHFHDVRTGDQSYPIRPRRRYFLAVTVTSMWAAGAASFVTPTVVREGRGSGKNVT